EGERVPEGWVRGRLSTNRVGETPSSPNFFRLEIRARRSLAPPVLVLMRGRNAVGQSRERGVWSVGHRLLPLILPHQLSLGEDAPIHHTDQILFCRARFEGDFCVERVEFEKITVRAAGGRTGTAIADALEIVDALLRPGGEDFGGWNLFWKLCLGWRESVEDPVDPRADRRVRVVTDKYQAFGACGNVAPFQWRGNVLAIAGVFRRNEFAFGKGGTGQLDRHSGFVLSLRWPSRDQ